MRAEESSYQGQLTSIGNVTDTFRDVAKKEFHEGSRRGFLSRAAGAAGLLLGGASLAHAARPKPGKNAGTGIQASSSKKPAAPTLPQPAAFPNWNATNFGQIRTDENAHVNFLVGSLGSAARPRPTFQNLQQTDVIQFAGASYTFENTGVGAYLGAAPAISNPAYLAAAASILTIEARHSGFLGTLFNLTTDFNGHSFDGPFSIDMVVAGVTPFVSSLNGGPPLTFSSTPSAENDIAILNFALALEYLERDFYNINVPIFFGI